MVNLVDLELTKLGAWIEEELGSPVSSIEIANRHLISLYNRMKQYPGLRLTSLKELQKLIKDFKRYIKDLESKSNELSVKLSNFKR